MDSRPLRIAVVGGGMAGLAAAWRLRRADGPGHEVTVYQRGWRLGGKGASSRGDDGRILEHGLHIWLGYYDNAFRLLREVYAELDRAHADPECPIATIDDAFLPANVVGLGEHDAGLAPWLATFPTNGLVPGEGTGTSLPAGEFVTRAASLVGQFGASLAGPPPRAVLSTRPRRSPVPGLIAGGRALLREPTANARTRQFVELLLVMLRGVAADDLFTRGYAAIDHLDFREWLAKHGASETVLQGPFVRGVYDLVFGYEGGDRQRPRFAAGTGVHLSGRMFLTYRGSIFWKMAAGMGDVVFAPLYQALRARGVHFRFFHRLTSVGTEAGAVSELTFARQLDVPDYDPLVRVGGLPVFPEWPAILPRRVDLERHGCRWDDDAHISRRRGRDFDAVVLAVSLGMLPHVAAELVGQDERWRSMVDRIGTVATQSVQLWFEDRVGAPDAVITGFGPPLDTVASMTHTIAHEAWPAPGPQSAVSLCSVLGEGGGDDTVRSHCAQFLAGPARRMWPGLGVTPRASYVRANTDPSDRYVQSLPGSGAFRMRADDSGYAGLFLAGDWLDTGLNAGCIEAATLGGLQAANAVEGRPVTDGTVGFGPHQPRHTVAAGGQ